MEDESEPYVFVSYSWKNKEIVTALVASLRAAGLPVRWDGDLESGDPWDETLDRWLTGASAVVVVWSADAAQSNWVNQEATLAQKAQRLVPVRLDSQAAIPDRFRNLHAPDLRSWTPGDDHELEPIIQRIRRHLREPVRAPTDGPSPTEPPSSPRAGHGPLTGLVTVLDSEFDARGGGIVIDPGWVATTAQLEANLASYIRSPNAGQFETRVGGRLGGVTLLRIIGNSSVLRPGPATSGPVLGEPCTIDMAGPSAARAVGEVIGLAPPRFEVVVPFNGYEVAPGAAVIAGGRLIGLTTGRVDRATARIEAIGGQAIDRIREACASRPGADLIARLVSRAAELDRARGISADALLVAILDWAAEIDGDNTAGAVLRSIPGGRRKPLDEAKAQIRARSTRSEVFGSDRPTSWPRQWARTIAEMISPGSKPGLRHLLATALLAGPIDPRISGILGASQSQMVARLAEAAGREHPAEADRWDDLARGGRLDQLAVLDNLRVSDLGGGSEVEPDEATDLSGYIDSDHVNWDLDLALDDRLNLMVYVRMLASVLAARDTPMPISVGVFGHWGSGKTFFMRLIAQEMRRLASVERQALDAQPDHARTYCAEIRQVTFNAWHYADANLWASLTAHLFDQLAGTDGDERVAPVVDREVLIGRLGVLEERRAELQAQADAADTEVKRLEERIEAIETDETALGASAAQTVAEGIIAATATPAGKEATRELADEVANLGIRSAGVEDLPQLLDDLGTTRVLLQRARRLATPNNVKAAALYLAGIVVGLTVLVVSKHLVSALSGVLVPLFGLVAWAQRSLASVRRHARVVAEQLGRQAREQAAQATAELIAAKSEHERLDKALADATAEVVRAKTELADLSSTRQLARFIGERCRTDDYRKHLGMISVVRNDLDVLVTMLRARLSDPASQGDRAVERIVLYVDDLDRCPPERVVEVLEAVHLLLALDLFVVVVGVDARWLLRSLAAHHQILGTEDAAAGGLDQDDPARPLNYLEKIFQIPFVLPRMDERGLGKLLAGLLRPDRSSAPHDVPELPEDIVNPTAEGDASEVDLESDHLSVPDEEVDPAEAVEQPRSRDLTPDEIGYIQHLASLLRTPRAAKRLANIYRMFRSNRELGTTSSFLGAEGPAEFRAIAELLAISAGFPELFPALCWAGPGRGSVPLMTTAETEWEAFLHGVRPVESPEGWSNVVAGALDEQDVRSWFRLADALEAPDLVAARAAAPSLAVYQRWAPLVARFSFQLVAQDARVPGGDVEAAAEITS